MSRTLENPRLRGGRLGRFQLLERATLAVARQQDVVALDHLVESGRLQAEQARRVLLYAARGFERRLDEPPLEARDHLAQADALGGHRDLGDVEARGALHVVG